MNKVALLVVFNHKYDANLPRLRKIYTDKFDNVFFLVPFYDGSDEDVISVYESSDNFSGYFPQAYQHLKNKLDIDYWFIVADDMIVNPNIDQETLSLSLGINSEDSFLPRINSFSPNTKWARAHKALDFTFDNPYIQISNELPSKEDAKKIFDKYNLLSKGMIFGDTYNENNIFSRYHQYNYQYFKYKKDCSPETLIHPEYPFAWGYSDIFCIGSLNMERFCHYCGVFSAANLFVEIAIPTSILLATKGKLITEHEINLKGSALWGNERLTELNKYNLSLSKLISEFPDEKLFIHPIKFSQWND